MSVVSVIHKPLKPVKRSLAGIEALSSILSEQEKDPRVTLKTAKVMLRAWARELDEDCHLLTIQNFTKLVISVYWQSIHNVSIKKRSLPAMYVSLPNMGLDDSVKALAGAIGRAGANLEVVEAAYELGNLYTAIMPDALRSGNGVFYTPPALVSHLLTMAEKAGVSWATASVADPACGGGAFLAPVAMRMLKQLAGQDADEQLAHIEKHLRGYEIDPFAAWLTQVFLEVALKDIVIAAGRPVKHLVTVCNTLEYFAKPQEKFDLVIGNPPYGKLKLTDAIKERYKTSLYGHPNLYGLFTHLAIDLVKQGGVIAYLTPTSFLSGEYFKNLRSFIRKHTAPMAIDFVAVRKGVFEDVLQETILASYKKVADSAKPGNTKVAVGEIITIDGNKTVLQPIGRYKLSGYLDAPWILPRHSYQADVICAMSQMEDGLCSWGYRVSTGQLVWNRHKEQLSDRGGRNSYPIIWAEAVTQDGCFVLKADKKNHKLWFKFQQGDNFLLTTMSCVLLQRTTAKEQEKRLITAVLPQHVIDQHGAVIVENHLNMIIPIEGKEPQVSLELLSIFLNSKALNDAFRAISGSVAVSAYELESLPFPSVSGLKCLKELVENNGDAEAIEQECRNLYTKTSK